MATSYANKGGSGNRAVTLTASSGLFSNNANLPYMQDGVVLNNAVYFNNGLNTADHWIKMDFGSGIDKRVYQIVWYASSAQSQGTWKVQASTNDSDWIDIGSAFTLGSSATQTIDLSANTTEYRYWKIQGVSGTTSWLNWQREFVLSYTDVHGQGDVIYIKQTTGLTDYQHVRTIIDGSYANGFSFGNIADISSHSLTFDFGEGASKVIDEVKWYQNPAKSLGIWKFQGSNDESNWTDIGNQFELGVTATTTISLAGNTTGYRYYRMQGVSGSTTLYEVLHREVEFKIDDAILTNIKKVGEVAYADIKSVQGVTKANIKKYQGID